MLDYRKIQLSTIKGELEQRLEKLGWTLYKLAKNFCELRAVEGEVSPPTRYHSAIGKAMENPARSRFETILQIVESLGGTLVIDWSRNEISAEYSVKYMSGSFVVGTSYFALLDQAIASGMAYANKGGKAEIWQGNEKICSTNAICDYMNGMSDLPNPNSYVVIENIKDESLVDWQKYQPDNN